MFERHGVIGGVIESHVDRFHDLEYPFKQIRSALLFELISHIDLKQLTRKVGLLSAQDVANFIGPDRRQDDAIPAGESSLPNGKCLFLILFTAGIKAPYERGVARCGRFRGVYENPRHGSALSTLHDSLIRCKSSYDGQESMRFGRRA